MKTSHAALICGALLAGSSSAIAAPATQAEATRLKSVFETYLGNGGGGASPVSVAPRGEDYLISFDLAQLARPLATFGFELQSQPFSFSATPQDDGLWRVAQNGMPEFQVKIKDQNMKLRYEGASFEGLYDPKMMGFVLGKTTFAGSTLENVTPNLVNIRRDGRSLTEITGVASGTGIASAVVKTKNESHSQSFKIIGVGNDVEIGVSTGAITSDVTIDSLRNGKIMDLWAFFVANPSSAALEGKLEDIKLKVRDALPIFNSVAQKATMQSISITSPVGAFGMRELGAGFNMTGVHKQGDLGIRMALSGVSVPQAILPPWSVDLAPTDLVLDLKATGYDLDAAVEEIFKVARPGVSPAESEEAGRRAVFALAPDGKVKITMAPSRIVSKLLTVTMEGEMIVTQPIPRGRLVMKAKGLEETIAALQAAAASDPSVQQALMGLIGAKGFGKAEPDGTLSWVIENPNGGIPTINGVSIPGMGGK